MSEIFSERIGSTIRSVFVKKGLTLGVAESCTGGYLSALLTREPGCSDYFRGGVVAYSDRLKVRILGVDPSVIERYGAVSEAVVLQMAGGIVRLADCDYGIAVSGIAGPGGGTKEKPVGTIWTAIVNPTKGFAESRQFFLRGSREEIIREVSDRILLHLYGEIAGSTEENID